VAHQKKPIGSEGPGRIGIRSPKAAFMRCGGDIVREKDSNSTITDVQYDYGFLFEEVKQVSRIVRGSSMTYEELQSSGKYPFLIGTAARPGYATEADIEDLKKNHPTDFSYTRDLMAKRIEFSRHTIDTYLKLNTKIRKP
jgi:hypothetical protein